MTIRFLLITAAFVLISATAFAQRNVVTFSKAELAQAVAATCNSPYAPRGAVKIHRNVAGNMVYLVAEGEREAVIFASSQSCNEISSDTLDLWRSDRDGVAVAQAAMRFDTKRLLVGTEGDGIAGNRFDVDRTGQYLVISYGNTSSVAAVPKPYRRLVELNFDAQRIFARRNGLFVVGNNPATNQLEGTQVRTEGGTLVAEAPMPLGGMPAGVRVLDYNESSDELLLGGLDASGQTSFVVLNITSGQASPVPTAKPGDDTGLFIADGALRARLTSGNVAQPQPGTMQQPGSQPQQPTQRRRGILGIFGRRE